jgi:YD repeat-containing protein
MLTLSPRIDKQNVTSFEKATADGNETRGQRDTAWALAAKPSIGAVTVSCAASILKSPALERCLTSVTDARGLVTAMEYGRNGNLCVMHHSRRTSQPDCLTGSMVCR